MGRLCCMLKIAGSPWGVVLPVWSAMRRKFHWDNGLGNVSLRRVFGLPQESAGPRAQVAARGFPAAGRAVGCMPCAWGEGSSTDSADFHRFGGRPQRTRRETERTQRGEVFGWQEVTTKRVFSVPSLFSLCSPWYVLPFSSVESAEICGICGCTPPPHDLTSPPVGSRRREWAFRRAAPLKRRRSAVGVPGGKNPLGRTRRGLVPDKGTV